MEVRNLTIETWTWWSVNIVAFIGRIISRSLQRGIKNLQIEDYLMLFLICTYTTMVVLLNKIYVLTNNLNILNQNASHETATSFGDQIKGSKFTIVMDQCQLATLAIAKACMLLLYHRLTTLFDHHIWVTITAIYSAVGYLIMQVLFFGVWCRPFAQYWAENPENTECATYHNHLIVTAVWALSSDLMILCIPMPLLFTLHMPIMRKLMLYCLLGIGLFAIIAACISKVHYFTDPLGLDWPFWLVREVSSAVLVANLPFWWTLLRRILPPSPFGSESDMPSADISHTIQLPKTTLDAASQDRKLFGSEGIWISSRLDSERTLVEPYPGSLSER